MAGHNEEGDNNLQRGTWYAATRGLSDNNTSALNWQVGLQLCTRPLPLRHSSDATEEFPTDWTWSQSKPYLCLRLIFPHWISPEGYSDSEKSCDVDYAENVVSLFKSADHVQCLLDKL